MTVRSAILSKNITIKQNNNNKALYNYFSHLHASLCHLTQLKTQASETCIIYNGDAIQIKQFTN